MRQIVAVKGSIFDGEKFMKEAVEVWTNGEMVSFTYKDMTIAVEIEPVKKLITQVRKARNAEHSPK